MDLTLQPNSTQCAVTGQPLKDGDRVVSYLGHGEAGAVDRWDLLATAEPQFSVPVGLICRWVHVYKQREKEENADRNLKLGAESLFTTLCDPSVELGEENTPLVQFLALMLERKKLLRPKGLTADRARRIYEHAKTRQLYEVPVGDLTPQFFVKVQQQLGVLVGEPKKKAAVAPPSAASPAVPASARSAAVAPTPTPDSGDKPTLAADVPRDLPAGTATGASDAPAAS